jgi:hypothetical protein
MSIPFLLWTRAAEEVVTKIVKHDMYYPMISHHLEDGPQAAIAETPVEV